MNSQRIYVNKLPKDINIQDISFLFSKLIQINEIYLSNNSLTGHPREFAIISFFGDNELLKKCVKTFNGCHWKGSKIRVEIAQEYYKDKIEREKIETIQHEQYLQKVRTELPPKLFSEGSILKVKRRKNEHVYIAAGIIANKSTSQDILPCGKLKKFQDDNISDNSQSDSDSSSDDNDSDSSSDDSSNDNDNNNDNNESKQVQNDKKIIESKNEKVNIEKENQIPKLESVEQQPQSRKGLRIGFGSIASLPPRSTTQISSKDNLISSTSISSKDNLLQAPPCQTCGENDIDSLELETLVGKKRKNLESNNNNNNNSNNNNNNINESVVITEDGIYDDLSSSDDENCVLEEELTENSLKLERERQKKILDLIQEKVLHYNPSEVQIVSFDNSNNSNIDIQEIDAIPIVEPLKKTPRAMWSQSSLRFDPLKHQNINTRSKYYLSNEEVIERDMNNNNNNNNNNDTNGNDNNSQLEKTTAIADLAKLKGIFHREGGLGWDSQGKGAIQRDENSEIVLDDLVLEAERFGLDVHDTNLSKDISTSLQSSNTISSSSISNSQSKGMVFGFFNDSLHDNNEDSNESDSNNNNSDDDDDSDNDSILSDDNSENLEYDAPDYNSNNEENKINQKSITKIKRETQKNNYPTFDEVLQLAKQFKRDMSETQIIENWRNTREKLITDYKRKSKEARKRSEQFSSNLKQSIESSNQTNFHHRNNNSNHNNSNSNSGSYNKNNNNNNQKFQNKGKYQEKNSNSMKSKTKENIKNKK